MKPRVVILVSDDPRLSHKPAEAIRIAAGIAGARQAELTLYLRDAALLAAGECSDELKDGENFARYLPPVAEAFRVCAQAGSPFLAEVDQVRWKIEAIDDQRLSELIAGSNCLLRF